MSRYLLDTNMLLGFVRSAPRALRIREEHSLSDLKGWSLPPSAALAIKQQEDSLQRVLSKVPSCTWIVYALIDWTTEHQWTLPTAFLHQSRLSQCHKTTFGLPLPPANGAALVSTDGDFGHLNEIWQLIYVDQT